MSVKLEYALKAGVSTDASWSHGAIMIRSFGIVMLFLINRSVITAAVLPPFFRSIS
jgi:hypothetical protein